ncbi:MAG: hypothetical protein HYX84_02615 [Chloroflexi bacterium]|nr:hypothetical protein [Chloroflexota bacterium]
MPITPPQPVEPGEPEPEPPIFPADPPVIVDIIGTIWTLPNTGIGLILGAMSGGTFEDGPRGTVKVTNVNPKSLTGQSMSLIQGNPVTIGYVILTWDTAMTPTTERHELGHVTQGAILGPLYLPLYILDSIIHPKWENKLMERTVPPFR